MRRLLLIPAILAMVFTLAATDAEARKTKAYREPVQPQSQTRRLSDSQLCDGGVLITAQEQATGCSRIIASRVSRARKAVAHYNRANALVALSQVADAVEDYSRAIALDATYAQAYFNRAIAHQITGNWQMAKLDLDAALSIDANDADAYAARGMIHLRRAAIDRAMEDFGKALELRPRHGMAATGKGHAHALLRDWPEAITAYDRALEVMPHDADALYGRGIVNLWSGKASAGENDMAQARSLDPSVPERLAALGLTRTPAPLATAAITP